MTKEIAVENILTEHKKLHEELNNLKTLAGLPVDKYEKINHSLKLKEIFAKYAPLINVTEDDVIMMFNSCGDLKEDYHIIKSKKVCFSSEDEARQDEEGFYSKMNFKEATISISETKILDLIKKDKRITPEIIAKVLKTTPEYVTAKIAKLVTDGILESKTVTVGEDDQIERTLTKPLSEIAPERETSVEVFIKYSYEGPKDSKNRPFCAKMLELDRLYSRAEIERISLRLGYSVFDRRGGWWTKPNGEHSPTCRHRFVSHIVTRKRK